MLQQILTQGPANSTDGHSSGEESKDSAGVRRCYHPPQQDSAGRPYKYLKYIKGPDEVEDADADTQAVLAI
eukprot:8196230-Karenia_brevis.AAC.1